MKKSSSHTRQNLLHLAFEIGIFLKGLNAAAELFGGLLLVFFSNLFLTSWILRMSAQQLLVDPDDRISKFAIHAVNQFSVSSQHFIAFYLLIHGAVKIILVINLLRNKLWAYPTSIFVFLLFIAYQLYRFSISGSYWLLALSFFDLVVIFLTWNEYKRKRYQLATISN
jgi:uncharacterized membrane protein